MNINNGKTGNVNIPGPLHSTGGDGDGQVGGVVAYAGDVYDETLGKNQKEINQTLLEGGSDSDVIAVALNDLNEKVEDQEKVTSNALNDLSDKTDNLNKDVENLERITSSSLNDLNIKVEEQEKITSSSLNDLNEKVDDLKDSESVTASALVDLDEKIDNLNNKVNNNELITASALTDLNDKCVQKDENGNVIIQKSKLNVHNSPKHITKKTKIRFINDVDLFISKAVKILKDIYEEEFTSEVENAYKQEIRERQNEYKLFVIDNDEYQNIMIAEIYDSNNNLLDDSNQSEFPGLVILSNESSIVANTDYYINDFNVFNEDFINYFKLDKSGLFYLSGIGNYSGESSDENPKSVQEVISNLESGVQNLQSLNLDFKDNLKIDDQGDLVIHKVGNSDEKEIHGSSGFRLLDDYEEIYEALTYDPDSSTTPQLDGYTQQELRQMLIEDNLINPNYYYYVVANYGGSSDLTNQTFFSKNYEEGFSKFISVEINDTDVEFSDYIEKFDNDGAFARIVIGLETEFSGDLSNVLLTYENYPRFDKYICKVNLDNGKLYLPGLGDYTARNPSNGVLSVQEVIASLISRIETLENQISGGGNS